MCCAAVAPTPARTLAPGATNSPASSLDPCTATELSKIAACRAPSLQTEASCKGATSSSCKWCPSNLGLDAGCYVADPLVVCDTTGQTGYLGDSCPVSFATVSPATATVSPIKPSMPTCGPIVFPPEPVRPSLKSPVHLLWAAVSLLRTRSLVTHFRLSTTQQCRPPRRRLSLFC